MIVDVVRLREAGKKLPASLVKEAAPIRGVLRIVTEPWREHTAPHQPRVQTTFARLAWETVRDPWIAPPLSELRDARVTKLDGDSFVIVGLERHGDMNRHVDHPQAWWCRLATLPGAAPTL